MNHGFSLIELMIVLTLISILSLISYPLYSDYLIRVRRVCATVALADAAGKMEKYRLSHGNYDGAKIENLSISASRCDECYRFGVKSDENSYTLEAAPIGKQEKDVVCGTLTIDQDGNRGVRGDARCWL